MKPDQRLSLDREHLIQMLSRDDFFQECPVFEYLREAALASYTMWKRSAGCCGGRWEHMRGVVDAFFIKIRELKEHDPASLEQVRGFLERRKGYVPRPIVIYYRRSRQQGKMAKFTF